MTFYKYKGKRIRASDKGLVYRFCAGTLLFVFVAVLLLLNMKQLMRTDWEHFSLLDNGLTLSPYPDIISVIKMSDCYEVSLDYLLKGEQTMKTYYEYLEESTNVVKSNTNRNKIIIILSYMLVWAIAMIAFWFFTSGSDAMGYSLVYLWILLPVTTFIVSFIIGKNDFWAKGKWALTLFFGVMYMLAEYGTFAMANNIAFDKLNTPEWGLVVAGVIISAIGMLMGSLLKKKRCK